MNAIAVQWTFSLCFGLMHMLIWNFEDINITIYSDILLDVLVIVISIIINVYFFRKLKSMIRPTSSINIRENGSRILFKLKIPCLMVLTFIIFNASATILIFLGEMMDLTEQLKLVFNIFDMVGWCSDALIYILLQRRVRQMLVSICKGGNRNWSAH